MKRLLTLLTMMLVAYGVQAESMFYFGTLSIKPGETKQIELCLLNEAICEGFQLKLTLPEGLSFIQDEEEEDYVIKVSDRVKKKFNVESNLLPNGSLNLVGYLSGTTTIAAGDGAILLLTVKAADNAPLGVGKIQIANAEINLENSVNINPSDAEFDFTVYQEYTVTAAPADEKQGTVTGGGSYDSGSKVTVTATAAAGYEFVNWTSGETVASTENPYEFTVTENITLTAHFQAITYNLTYDLANGALPEGKTNPATYTVATDDIVLVNPELTGYDFAGWTGTDLTEATKAVTIAKGSTGDRSYTATWTATEYAITYDLAGGKLADGDTNPASYTIESDAITLKNPTREGYTFAGWTGTGLTEASTAVTIAKGSMGARTYTATWTPITYTITYDLDGGAVATANPATYTIESDAITLVNPTKDGFDFAGWTGTGLTEATKNVTIAKGSTGDRTYTATWTPASGIKAIFSDSKTVNVYRVNGTLVGRDMTVDEVIQLKHGVYVVNGKKIAIK